MSRKHPTTQIWLHLILQFTFMINLFACSLGQQAHKNGSTTPLPTQASSSSVDTSGPVIITFAAPTGQRSLYEASIAAFNQDHEGIRVQFVTLENSNDLQKQASSADTSILSGSDIFSGGAYFTDLQPLMDADPTFQPDDFWSGLLKASQDAQGHTTCIPLTVGIHGIYYDKQAYTAAGLPEPKPGWTWNEFRNDVRSLASPQRDTIRYGFADGNTPYTSLLDPLLDAYLCDNDGKLDAVTLQTNIQWYLDLVESKAIYPMQDASVGAQALGALFQSDTRPMMWTGYLATPLPGSGGSSSGSASWSELAVATEGFAPFPADENNPNTTPVFAYCAAISTGSQHPQAAWEWIQYLTQHWVTMPEWGVYGIAQTPARQSVANTVDYWHKLPENVAPTVRFGLEHAWLGPHYPDQVNVVVQAVIQSISNKSDLAAALNDISALGIEKDQNSTPTVEVPVNTPQPTVALEDSNLTYAFTFAVEKLSSDAQQNAFKNLAKAYNRDHPENAVEITLQYLSNYIYNPDEPQVVLADCFAFTSSPKFWLKPELLSLEPFLSAEDAAFLKDYPPELLDEYRIDGDLYGLPAVVQPRAILYNANLLVQAGLRPPENDWTFDNFIDMLSSAESMAEGDRRYGYLINPITDDVDFFLAGRGVSWIDLDSDPPMAKLDSPEIINALTWLGALKKTGSVLYHSSTWNFLQMGDEAGQITFWQGCAGDEISGNCGWMQGDFEKRLYNAQTTRVVPLPSTILPYRQRFLSSWGYYIPSAAKNPQGCWDWIKYLSEQPNIFPGVPARISVANSAAWEAQVGKDRAEVYRLALERDLTQRNVLSDLQMRIVWGVNRLLQNAADAIIDEGQDAQQTLVAAQRKAESYLACINTIDTEKLTGMKLSEAYVNCLDSAEAGNR